MTDVVGGGAERRIERVLALAALVARCGALALLLVGLVRLLSHPRSAPANLVVVLCFASAVAASVVVVVAIARTGELKAWWSTADAALFAILLYFSAVAPHAPATESPLYNSCVLTVALYALPRGRLAAVLLRGGMLSVANIATVIIPEHTEYPTRQAWVDLVPFIGTPVLGFIIGSLLRRGARSLDEEHQLAVTRAAELARQREVVRQADALDARLLSTLERLAAGAGGIAPTLRDQVGLEARWLRDMVTGRLADHGQELGVALTELVDEKQNAGMTLTTSIPDELPSLPPGSVAALVDATREALTNVVKHAGTTGATIAVRMHGRAVEVLISDTGRGYDPATSPTGIGQRQSIHDRLAEQDGEAEISSVPGRGTTVALRIPASRRGGTS